MRASHPGAKLGGHFHIREKSSIGRIACFTDRKIASAAGVRLDLKLVANGRNGSKAAISGRSANGQIEPLRQTIWGTCDRIDKLTAHG